MGVNVRGTRSRPEFIENSYRKAKALNLRKAGMTYAAIAAECGWNSPQAAQDALKKAIEAIAGEPAKELLDLELGRLDALFGPQYVRATTGDLDALNGCLKIMERRARLLGMDAPVKTEAKVEQSNTGGVLVVPGIMDEASWLTRVAESQVALAEKEAKVLQQPVASNKTRRRVVE